MTIGLFKRESKCRFKRRIVYERYGLDLEIVYELRDFRNKLQSS